MAKGTSPKKKKPPVKRTPKTPDSPEKAFRKAMLAFQSEMQDLPRTEKAVSKNGKVYHFTPLPLMRKILQPLLTKHQFIYWWDSKEENGKIVYTCILQHVDGHFITSSMTSDRDNSADMLNNLQAVGSSQTYLQRYTLKGVLGLTSADDDDDGTSAGETREVIPGPEEIQAKLDEFDFDKKGDNNVKDTANK